MGETESESRISRNEGNRSRTSKPCHVLVRHVIYA